MVFAREPPQTREHSTQFVGAIGCKSSSCHGGAGEKRSQYITWSQKDFHAKAFVILTDARSARIAEGIGVLEAQSSARCTVCHSPLQAVPQARLSHTAGTDEGVSCESCHGAAGPWLRGHTRPDWTYAMRVGAGMHDLRNLYERANACVACHQNLDNDLVKAGHPMLTFELDGQSINEPKHWREEEALVGAAAWLTGQAVALREAAWHSRTDEDPSKDSQETSVALAWLLSKATTLDPDLPKVFEPSTSNLEALQTEADKLARYAANWRPSVEIVTAMLRGFAETDGEFVAPSQIETEALPYRAERIALALDRLVAALNATLTRPLRTEHELGVLREDARYRDSFAPARFAADLRAFRAKL
jgi:Cytochrome c554 and c-prime